MMKFSILLNAKESVLLLDYMKENKVKTKAEAIRKYLKTAVSTEAKYVILKDIDGKLNIIMFIWKLKVLELVARMII